MLLAGGPHQLAGPKISRHSGGEVFSPVFCVSRRRRHTRYIGDWSSDVCSSDLLYNDVAARRFRLRSLSDAAELALSYYVVALLYTSAVAATAPMMAKVSGYVLLLVGYLLAHLGFTAAKLWLEGSGETIDVRRILLAESRVLLIVTPVVVAEVMAYQVFGLVGFAIAFLPVLVVAYAMRNEADAGRRNAELVRRNRELSILTESATKILTESDDQETLRRMVTLIGQLA